MELRDAFGRKIDYLRVSVTDRCNLRCVYCRPGEARKCGSAGAPISMDTVLRFLQACRAYGLRKVRLTGGEPLMREDIIDIVERIKAMGIDDLSLTTNGIALAEKAAQLRRAGLDRVNISLDSLVPGRFRRISGGGRLENVIAGMESAREAGFAGIKINMVPIRGLNDTEVGSFASMTIEQDMHVRFIELMNIGAASWQDSRRVTSDDVLQRLSSVFGELQPCGDYGSSRNFRIRDAKGMVGLISPMSRHFCGSCNRLRLKPDGRIRPCLFSDYELRIWDSMSDAQIEDTLRQAVRSKPEGRGAAGSIPLEAMSQIGG